LAASLTDARGDTVMTGDTMTSQAFIAFLLDA
jgi:hypothetical protein